MRPNKSLDRSWFTCYALTERDETYWTSNDSDCKIGYDRVGRDDRRGIGARKPVPEFGISGQCADQW